MVARGGIGSRLYDLLIYLFLILFCLSILYPFGYMAANSVSDYRQVGLEKVQVMPKGFHLGAYEIIVSAYNIRQAYWNSTRYTAVGTLLTLAVCSLAGYSLSKRRLVGRTFYIILFTITMFFTGGLIPTYLNILKLGLFDSIWAIVLPGAFNFWYIIILRTNIQQIPNDLIESAHMDGASDWFVYLRIVLPLSQAILATVAIWRMVAVWNEFFAPLLYLNSEEKMPLTIILRRILITQEENVDGVQADHGADPLAMDWIVFLGLRKATNMAAVLLTIGPIILTYPFFQKYFVRGILIGSLKG